MPHAPQVAVVTDSTSDIPRDIARELNIQVVPALLTVEGQTYRDGVGLTRAAFYERLPTLSEPATTAAPSPQVFAEAYERALRRGAKEVLSIHLSPKLSGILNAAAQGAKAFGARVQTFDSGQLSLGLGFQAMEAATAALAGASLEAVIQTARRAQERVHLVAMIDTLEYLRRSGRVGWLRAGLGNLLQVKLLVEVVDGVVERLGQVRTRAKALASLCDLVRAWGPLQRAAVIHSAIPEEAQAYAARLRDQSQAPPLVVDVTTIIGAHVGPRSLGVVGLSQ